MDNDGMTTCINRLLTALEGVYPSAQVWIRCMELAYRQGCTDTLRAAYMPSELTDAEVLQ